MTYSVSPARERSHHPDEKDYAAEVLKLQQLVSKKRVVSKEIVVVMGLGFVGAALLP